MPKQNKLTVKSSNDGETINEHRISDSDVRFTVPNLLGGEKLVAWWRNGSFVWICNGYSA